MAQQLATIPTAPAVPLPTPVVTSEPSLTENKATLTLGVDYTPYGAVTVRYKKDAEPTASDPAFGSDGTATVTRGGKYYVKAFPPSGSNYQASPAFSMKVVIYPSVWTASMQTAGEDLEKIVFAFGKFYAILDDSIMVSENGETWTASYTLDSGNSFYALGAVGGKILAGAVSKIIYSENGTDWNVVTKNMNGVPYAFGYDGTRFVLVTNYGSVYSSSDMTTWTSHHQGTYQATWSLACIEGFYLVKNNAEYHYSTSLGGPWMEESIVFANTSYGAVSHEGIIISGAGSCNGDFSAYLRRGKDGILRPTMFFPQPKIYTAFQAGDLFFLAEEYFYASEDGLIWHFDQLNIFNDTSVRIDSIAYGNGMYIALATTGSKIAKSLVEA